MPVLDTFVLKRGDTRDPLVLQFTMEDPDLPEDAWPPMNCTDAVGNPRFFMRPSWWPSMVERTPPPTDLVAVPATTGGSLATGTYRYLITPLVGGRELAPSAEFLADVVGPTGSVKLAWMPSPGATSYRVYRSTLLGGPYVRYATGVTDTFTDTGGPGAAGHTPPAAKVSADASWDSRVNGIGRYAWQPEDVNEIGSWVAEMETVFPDGTRATAPNAGYLKVLINPDLD